MNLNKKIVLCLCPLFLVMLLLLREKPISKEAETISRTVASTPTAPTPTRPLVLAPVRNHVTHKKSPFKNKNLDHEDLRNRLPQSVKSTLIADPEIVVTRGHIFLKEIAAIPLKEYKESMGEVIKRDGNFVYFRAGENHLHTPVALSKSTNMLYPISSVLHIQGATPEIRTELINEGYKQYYYHAPLKFLSLQSGSDGVMKAYSDLLEKGYKVELEVLKPGHQTF